MTGPAEPTLELAPRLLRICDDAGEVVTVEGDEASALWSITEGFETATVSACATCACRVLAAVAVVDLLGRVAAHPMSGALCELADDAPTLHLYVDDPNSGCVHRTWRDPLAEEWIEVIDGPGRRPVR